MPDVQNLDSDFTAAVEEVAPPMPQESFTEVEAPKGSYTEDDLRKVREQEKSKLYPQIDSLKDELSALKREKEARENAEAGARAAADAEVKRRAEEEMDVRELLRQKEEEFASQLDAERL